MNKTERQYTEAALARGFKKGERIYIARKPNPGECVAEGWGDSWISRLDSSVGKWHEVTMIGNLGSPKIMVGSSREYVPYFICLREGELGVMPSTPAPTTYPERQAASGLQVGDTVRITRMPLDRENGWAAGLGIDMNRQVGKTGTIDSIHATASYGMRVRVEGETTYLWPYFVLQKEGAGLPAVVLPADGKTVILIDGHALLIGSFSKRELENILASPEWPGLIP